VSVEAGIKRSAGHFRRFVWPAIAPHIGGGVIESVEEAAPEGRASAFIKSLDTLAGIDVWQVVQGAGIRGIASRVQYTPRKYKAFETLTVRALTQVGSAETEFRKITRIVHRHNKGFLAPGLVCHAYLRGEKDNAEGLIHALLVRASDFYPVVAATYAEAEALRRPIRDGDQFTSGYARFVPTSQMMIVFPRQSLEQSGVEVRVICDAEREAAA